MLFLTMALLSCARVQTLNLEKHQYSERPRHIVWIQLAGFSEEHLPLLKFNVADANYKTSLEKIDCLGKMWAYNLYDLRPSSINSFTSQTNGSKNTKGTCEDFQNRPVWDYLLELGYSSSLFESGVSDEQSLENATSCSNSQNLNLSKLRLYRMGPDAKSNKKVFHYQDSPGVVLESLNPGVYYDRSCQKNICYSSLSNNFKTLWSEIIRQPTQTFFLLRDFNFMKALKKKDIGFAKESLQEIERIVSFINSLKRSDVLVIVSGAESLPIEFPKAGKEWSEFEKSGKNIIFKNSSLMSPVLANGPMAENFCGLFDESEMMKRVLNKPERKQFNWDLVNPLSN